MRKENRELITENHRLLAEQIRFMYTELYKAGNQNSQKLASRIQELQENLFVRFDGMSRLTQQQILANGESTRAIVSSTKQEIEDDTSRIYSAVNNLAKMTKEVQSEMKTAFSSEEVLLKEAETRLKREIAVDGDSSRKALEQVNTRITDGVSSVMENHKKEIDSVILSISKMEKSVSGQNKDIEKQISQSSHNILERQQQLSSDSCELIVNANRDLVSRVEQYSTSAFEEVKNTAEKYQQMEHDEQESLDKIRILSSEMLELGEHQKKVMEQLSQLCQDSDQFMEIQKSINDMWEIMKAVWVDSLLNDFNNNLNGNIEK